MNEGLAERTTLKSSQISGGGDADRLESDLSALEGVRRVNVDPNAHAVTVEYDPTIVDDNAIRAAVEDAGYKIDSSGSELEAGSETGGF
jgi:copper chaperone CopZ